MACEIVGRGTVIDLRLLWLSKLCFRARLPELGCLCPRQEATESEKATIASGQMLATSATIHSRAPSCLPRFASVHLTGTA